MFVPEGASIGSRATHSVAGLLGETLNRPAREEPRAAARRLGGMVVVLGEILVLVFNAH